MLLEFRWERNSSDFRLQLKQIEAFSAASLPAGPEDPASKGTVISYLGAASLVAAQTDRLSLFHSFASAFSPFSAGGVMFPVACPLLYEAVRHTQLVGLQRAVWYSRPVGRSQGARDCRE